MFLLSLRIAQIVLESEMIINTKLRLKSTKAKMIYFFRKLITQKEKLLYTMYLYNINILCLLCKLKKLYYNPYILTINIENFGDIFNVLIRLDLLECIIYRADMVPAIIDKKWRWEGTMFVNEVLLSNKPCYYFVLSWRQWY